MTVQRSRSALRGHELRGVSLVRRDSERRGTASVGWAGRSESLLHSREAPPMTDLAYAPAGSTQRRPRPRRYLMTPPRHFAVEYAINPWMHPSVAVDADARARAVGGAARHVPPARPPGRRARPRAGLPDMVYAANGALVDGDGAVGARFAYPQRAAEAAAYAELARGARLRTGARCRRRSTRARATSWWSATRSWPARASAPSPAAHAEVAGAHRLAVVTLELVDPRFYHLDTALAVLDDRHGRLLPGRVLPGHQAVLRRRSSRTRSSPPRPTPRCSA